MPVKQENVAVKGNKIKGALLLSYVYKTAGIAGFDWYISFLNNFWHQV